MRDIYPDQQEYPSPHENRPSAAQLWKMWREERKRADDIETIGRAWMAEVGRIKGERDKAIDCLKRGWRSKQGAELAQLEAVVIVEALKIAKKRGWFGLKETA